MIALLDRRRGRLLAGLILVAMVQLAATVTVAHCLHGLGPNGWQTAAFAAVIAFACETLLRRLSEGLGLDYVASVRDALFRHLMTVEPAIVQRRRHGAILQSFVGDLTALRQWVSEGIMRAFLAVIALAGLLAWLCLNFPTLGAVAVAIVVASGVAGAALLAPLWRAVRQVRRERGQLSAFASERLAASATILACARAGSEARRLEHRVERFNAAALQRAWLTGALRALPHLATTAIVISAVLLGQTLAGGGMAGVVLVIGIMGLALRDLARAAELAVPGRISARRVKALMELPPLALMASDRWVRGEAGKLVLDSLVLRRGSVPLSGIAASGEVILLDGDPEIQTALIRAMSGLTRSLGGSVRWCGADLAGRKPSRRRRIVGVTSSDLPVLRASNGYNLRYRAPAASDQEVAELAQEWDIDLAATDANPARLALARAMLGKPPVLLLAPDERTLSDQDAARLARNIVDWPGVVLLVSRHPQLVRSATRRWAVGPGGLAEQALPRSPLSPVHKGMVA